MIDWVKNNLDIVLEDGDPDASHDSVVVVEKSSFPLSFNVEVGLHINAIRTSLDLLATALAHRYGIARPDHAYFPIVDSRAAFASGKYRGKQFVEGLPLREREIIEYLEPYRGGNDLLILLHDMDVQRKHRKLLAAQITPSKFGIKGGNFSKTFVPNSPGFPRTDNKTELGKLAKGAARPQIQLHAYVAFDEAFFPKGVRVSSALNDFAGLAKSIVALFDDDR